MADGKLTAADINVCRSGQTEAWTLEPEVAQGIYGLANAFLRAGTQQYIGTFWEIPDEPSRTLAIEFYHPLGGLRPGSEWEFREEVPLGAGMGALPFEAEDAAGNVTRGEIALSLTEGGPPGIRKGDPRRRCCRGGRS
jgi:hypothetical protein